MGDNGKENGNYYNGLYRDYRVIWVVVKIMIPFLGTLIMGIIGVILGFYGDNGKENGNYYNGLYRDYRVIWVVVKIMIPFWGTLIMGIIGIILGFYGG